MTSIKSIGYNVEIGKNSLKQLSKFLTKSNYSAYYIMADENTNEYCMPILLKHAPQLANANVFEIESGESNKVLEVASNIWQTLLESNADKNALLINLGGGMISDLGGFIASVYKRGIDFINIPTSLLAMADASVGGKNGIDFGGIKNSIGTITQPKAVFVYTEFIETLPKRHIYNGMAEVYKMGLIADKKYWQLLSLTDFTDNMEQVIAHSIYLKNEVVKLDPFDKKQRKALNFGHSIGHAIEALSLGSKDELLHGEAIIIGMIMEAHISYQKKLLTKLQLDEILNTFFDIFEPVQLKIKNNNDILSLIKNDKKNTKGKSLFTLLHGIGKCRIDAEVNDKEIVNAINYYTKLKAWAR